MRVNFNAPVLPVTEKKVVHNIAIMDEQTNAIRPVNINSIKLLIHKGIKYTVE